MQQRAFGGRARSVAAKRDRSIPHVSDSSRGARAKQSIFDYISQNGETDTNTLMAHLIENRMYTTYIATSMVRDGVLYRERRRVKSGLYSSYYRLA